MPLCEIDLLKSISMDSYGLEISKNHRWKDCSLIVRDMNILRTCVFRYTRRDVVFCGRGEGGDEKRNEEKKTVVCV